MSQVTVTCRYCGGDGRVIKRDKSVQCGACAGDGVLHIEESAVRNNDVVRDREPRTQRTRS